MQIIFEKTIIEQIEDAKKSAEVAGKTIKEIRLSKVETEQFKREIYRCHFRTHSPKSDTILGIKVILYQPEESTDF